MAQAHTPSRTPPAGWRGSWVCPDPSVSPAETGLPGTGSYGMARPRFSCLHTFSLACPTYQRLAMLCLRVSVQQGPLAVVWPLSCPLVHQGEAQRSDAWPHVGGQPVQVGQRAACLHGCGEIPTAGAWQGQRFCGTNHGQKPNAQLPNSRRTPRLHLERGLSANRRLSQP